MLDKSQLLKILSEDKVFNDDKTLDRFSCDQSFAPRRKPDFVVYSPKTFGKKRTTFNFIKAFLNATLSPKIVIVSFGYSPVKVSTTCNS